MKIVISKCGFYKLPFEVINRYFELSGMGKPYFYVNTPNWYNETTLYNMLLVDKPDLESGFLISLKNCGEKAISRELYKDGIYFDIDSIKRDDINLIKSVEEIKPYTVKIVEIPDDVKWYIHETESGLESIYEEHRIWN